MDKDIRDDIRYFPFSILFAGKGIEIGNNIYGSQDLLDRSLGGLRYSAVIF